MGTFLITNYRMQPVNVKLALPKAAPSLKPHPLRKAEYQLMYLVTVVFKGRHQLAKSQQSILEPDKSTLKLKGANNSKDTR